METRNSRPFVMISVLLGLLGSAARGQVDYVIHISVDGLRPDAITTLGPGQVPNFYRMRNEGAFTDNARTDYNYTNTLPNHVTQLTARSILGAGGHNWTSNSTPPSNVTLHTNKGEYVAGVFDVAHDSGLRTGLYAGKDKFILFDQSWDANNGAADTTGADDGRDKIDRYYYSNSSNIMGSFLGDMNSDPHRYAFVHFPDPDAMGHSYGWDPTPGSQYSNAIKTIDGYLGDIFDLISADPSMDGTTAVLLTADHGGTGTSHGSAGLYENYRIPFYVWGPGVVTGMDLYTLNPAGRMDPGVSRPPYSDPVQPIRHGDVTNLALDLLGLDPIPGSNVNPLQDLVVSIRGDANTSGYVDDDDLSLLLANWNSGTQWAQGDFNGDKMVDDDDLSFLLANWREGIAPLSGGGAVPEPASLTLIILGASLPLLGRRR